MHHYMEKECSMNRKPRREDFASDDDFGEAYGDWMAHQKKASSQAVKAPALKVIPVDRKLTQIPARLEAERDTWNQNTKARFLRAKENAHAAASKAKGMGETKA
jgi:hypothetical protein